MAKIPRKGMLVEYQEGFEDYDDNGHLIRALGKIVKVINKKKLIVLVKSKSDGKITKETIGETILYP